MIQMFLNIVTELAYDRLIIPSGLSTRLWLQLIVVISFVFDAANAESKNLQTNKG